MTHFASADEPPDPATRRQIERFAEAARRSRPRPLLLQLGRRARLARGPCRMDPAGRHALRHLADGRPHRPGRGPAPGHDARPPRLIAVREVQAGEAVGYGGAWRAASATPDRHRRPGLRRRLPAPCALRHAGPGQWPAHASPSAASRWTCWRSTSTDQPDAAVGDPVILWGQGLPAERVAASCRHHRLRAALRPRGPRPCRGPRRSLSPC